MGLFDGAYKKFINFFTPLFGVTTGAPSGYSAGEARPGTIDATTGGLRVFVVGNAEAFQEETANALADLYAKLAEPLGPWVEHDPVVVPAQPDAALQLPNIPCSELKVIADPGNTQTIYFGGANVSPTKSQDLSARELELVKRVSNADEFYVIAATGHAGQKIRIQTR